MVKIEFLVDCGKCGVEFQSGIEMEDPEEISLQGNLVKCENCGNLTTLSERNIHVLHKL